MTSGSNPTKSLDPSSKVGFFKAGRRRVFDLAGEGLFRRLQHYFEAKSPEESERSGEKLALWWYALDRKHRRRTLSNLSLAFPDWSDEQRLSTAKEVFRHFGRVAGDFLRSPARTNQEVLDTTEVEGVEHLEGAEAMGKGTIILTGHLGNWERAGQWMVASGRDLSVVARDADQRGVQAQVLRIRESAGVEVTSRGNSARKALTRLRANGRVVILADQNSLDTFVPFFGYPCGTVSGPAVLHRRTGAAICPVICIWLGYNRYKMIMLPLIDPENQEEDQDTLTALINKTLESVIREYPAQWLWMHDRWKAARRNGLLPPGL